MHVASKCLLLLFAFFNLSSSEGNMQRREEIFRPTGKGVVAVALQEEVQRNYDGCLDNDAQWTSNEKRCGDATGDGEGHIKLGKGWLSLDKQGTIIIAGEKGDILWEDEGESVDGKWIMSAAREDEEAEAVWSTGKQPEPDQTSILDQDSDDSEKYPFRVTLYFKKAGSRW